MIFNQTEYKMTVFILCLVPFLHGQDIAGFYILMAGLDINLAIRDILKNRDTAAMITWTEVISGSIFDFVKVKIEIF